MKIPAFFYEELYITFLRYSPHKYGDNFKFLEIHREIYFFSCYDGNKKCGV